MVAFKRWLVVVLGLLMLVVALGVVKVTQIQAAIAFGESFPEASETVESWLAAKSDWQPSLNVVGEVRAQRTLSLRNELEGVITVLQLPSGGMVKQGDILVRLDSALEEAQLAAIEAQMALSKTEVARFEKLVRQQAGAVEQLDRANAQLAIQAANADALRAQIAKKTLTAPFDAQVSIHNWQTGSYLAANTSLAELTQMHTDLWVDFSLPQRHLVRLPTQVSIVRLDTSLSQSANVVSHNAQLDASKRSLLVRASLKQTSPPYYAGEIVQVQVPVEETQPVFRLPATALRYDRFGNYVWILQQDEQQQWRAAYRPVTVVHKDADTVVVTQGIREGERIATVGSAKLLPNMWVKIAESAQ